MKTIHVKNDDETKHLESFREPMVGVNRWLNKCGAFRSHCVEQWSEQHYSKDDVYLHEVNAIGWKPLPSWS